MDAFSSSNLLTWKKHPRIIDTNSHSMGEESPVGAFHHQEGK